MNRSSATQATILIIDADPLMLTAIAAVINMAGHECHCARDPEAALKAARGLSLDLIVCDEDLPEGSGLELCRDLRRETGAADASILILAGETARAKWALDEGAGEFTLAKPIDPRILQETVERALWMPHLVRTRLELAHGGHAHPSTGPHAAAQLTKTASRL
jgi:DNA-binding response OmpR family regulator